MKVRVKVRVRVQVRVRVRVRVRVQVRGHPLRERAGRVLVHEVELDTLGRARFRARARVRLAVRVRVNFSCKRLEPIEHKFPVTTAPSNSQTCRCITCIKSRETCFSYEWGRVCTVGIGEQRDKIITSGRRITNPNPNAKP